jgi:23S rRNA (cytidine2498-2'-O)-methyltransferase
VLLVLAAPDSKDALQRELTVAFQQNHRELEPGLFACEATTGTLPYLAYARQVLPLARAVEATSIRAWAERIVEAVAGVLPDHQPWSLHVFPFKAVSDHTRMGARAWHTQGRATARPLSSEAAPSVGPNRCRLIREAVTELLAKRRRHLGRYLREQTRPFSADESLVQVLLTSLENGFLSVAPAPFAHERRHLVSHFPGGEVPLASDKQAPSRAFTKLVEAELRLGRKIAGGETCVDLGASPGSWTYVAVQRGARVTAVDRAELRADLLQHKRVHFQRGDAFRFEPAAPVDWLLCDVIAEADRTAELLRRWLRNAWCQHFVVTLKVDDSGSVPLLESLKRELPPLTLELRLLRLSANKKEVCAFGTRR